MKFTKTDLLQLIREEMGVAKGEDEQIAHEAGGAPAAETEDEEAPKAQELRQKLVDVAKTMTGIAPNEVEMVNFFIELIDLAKRENIAVGEFKRRLGMLQQAAQKI